MLTGIELCLACPPESTLGVVPMGGSIREGKCDTEVNSCCCRLSGVRVNGEVMPTTGLLTSEYITSGGGGARTNVGESTRKEAEDYKLE